MQTKSLILLLVFILSAQVVGGAAEPEVAAEVKKDLNAAWKFTPDPSLPNVLILGDSISIGYTLEVRERLQGKANVFRPMDGDRIINCNGTGFGAWHLADWLAGEKWSVIHFNWGLHDLKHVKTPGTNEKTNDPNAPTQATVEEYQRNLETIVGMLQATGARLVFATTTPVVPGSRNPLRAVDAPPRYNAAALKAMAANGIRVNDLYAYCLPNLEKWQRPKNVHFNSQGCAALAEQVATVIEEELAALATE